MSTATTTTVALATATSITTEAMAATGGNSISATTTVPLYTETAGKAGNTVTIVRGTLKLSLSTTVGFSEDSAVRHVLRESIAAVVAGIEKGMVSIESISTGDGRRLSTSAGEVT